MPSVKPKVPKPLPMEFVSPESTLIAGAQYDGLNMKLTVELRPTTTSIMKRYAYRRFPLHEWKAFLAAPSKGRYFQQNIRKYYVGDPV